MKPTQKEKIKLDELFSQLHSGKLDDAVNEVYVIESDRPVENWSIHVEVDDAITRVKAQVKTRTLKRWVYVFLAGGVGLTIQRVLTWCSEQFGK